MQFKDFIYVLSLIIEIFWDPIYANRRFLLNLLLKTRTHLGFGRGILT
jgi:hypothetical protein